MIWALVLVPLAAALGVRLLPRRADGTAVVLGVLVSLFVFCGAALGTGVADESRPWLSRPFAANLHVALGSGFAFWLILLLSLVSACALLAARVPRRRSFVSLILALLGTMVGLFVARDLLLFAVFWDLMLIPVFLLLVGWSPAAQGASAWRYLLYNLTGGLALLLATAAFGIVHGSTDVIGAAIGTPVGYVTGGFILAGFAFAFLIKTPIWPFHTWMPETYADLPAPAVAVVSAVQSKAGLYGFVAIGLPASRRGNAPRRGRDGRSRSHFALIRSLYRAHAGRRETHRRLLLALPSGTDARGHLFLRSDRTRRRRRLRRRARALQRRPLHFARLRRAARGNALPSEARGPRNRIRSWREECSSSRLPRSVFRGWGGSRAKSSFWSASITRSGRGRRLRADPDRPRRRVYVASLSRGDARPRARRFAAASRSLRARTALPRAAGARRRRARRGSGAARTASKAMQASTVSLVAPASLLTPHGRTR